MNPVIKPIVKSTNMTPVKHDNAVINLKKESQLQSTHILSFSPQLSYRTLIICKNSKPSMRPVAPSETLTSLTVQSINF